MADELHALLHAARVGVPCLLLGHSLGGLNAQLFAARYPGEVAGLVLVDSVVIGREDWWGAMLSGQAIEKQRRFWGRENGEHVHFDASIAEARAADWHTNVPLIVLARGTVPPDEVAPDWPADHERLVQAWWPHQRALAARSSRGQFQVAEASGHNIHRDQPDLVVATVREVVEAVWQ
jgi:pimeloyl-ACP methyl ester carboxylesterase